MKRVHVVGGKNHGKTTLIVDLTRALGAKGLRVGTIKHTHHHHELDTPGKDSFRHREAGAYVVGICSPAMNAVFWPSAASDPSGVGESKYAGFDTLFKDCDLVLVEGDSSTSAVKLEVWRKALSSSPAALSDPSISAIITDDTAPAGLDLAVWPRASIDQLVESILSLASVSRASSGHPSLRQA